MQLSQLIQTLQRTAPAGNPVEYLIQTAPIKAPFIAVGQTVLFGHTPFCERIGLVLDPLRFVGSDTDIFNDRVIFSQFFQIGVHHTGFEDARWPDASISAFTVGLRCSSASLTSERKGSMSWLHAGTAEWQ